MNMNTRDLVLAGCKKRELNGGTILEFYKPITGDGLGVNDSRLSVRFGEHKNEAYHVYLIVPRCMIKISGVHDTHDFFTLYKLITGGGND